MRNLEEIAVGGQLQGSKGGRRTGRNWKEQRKRKKTREIARRANRLSGLGLSPCFPGSVSSSSERKKEYRPTILNMEYPPDPVRRRSKIRVVEVAIRIRIRITIAVLLNPPTRVISFLKLSSSAKNGSGEWKRTMWINLIEQPSGRAPRPTVEI